MARLLFNRKQQINNDFGQLNNTNNGVKVSLISLFLLSREMNKHLRDEKDICFQVRAVYYSGVMHGPHFICPLFERL